ncbi:hypothetical protein DC366_01770 [Pelagivirga sediminicola]|uniref:Uncharacterized protein n=1 Tax=Pelagivirga sediminicola TaxID=2170575 RepID=A0A2T7GBC0_9RHOB|nr:hypothetical protein DC366_01770 [Pelagivirga sediminicola]
MGICIIKYVLFDKPDFGKAVVCNLPKSDAIETEYFRFHGALKWSIKSKLNPIRIINSQRPPFGVRHGNDFCPLDKFKESQIRVFRVNQGMLR